MAGSPGCLIPHTPIAVDYWRKRDIRTKICFLSHMHTDHTQGLTSSWNQAIYCSEITRSLAIEHLKIEPSLLIAIPVGQPTIISLDDKDVEKMTVTLIDANHCPGAVMFLFQGYFGCILHTGDFRYFDGMLDIPPFTNEIIINTLYLDNTYCDPKCEFPTRAEAKQKILEIIHDNPNKDIRFGLDMLGKEDLLCDIAKDQSLPIFVDDIRYKTALLLGCGEYFTLNQEETSIRVQKKSSVNRGSIAMLNSSVGPTIGIIPSALYQGRSNPFANSDTIFVVPYSDHSSFSELKKFVARLKPQRIVPIVVGRNKDEDTVNRANMSVFSDELSCDSRHYIIDVPPTVQSFMSSFSQGNGVMSNGVKRKTSTSFFSGRPKKACGIVFSPEKKAGNSKDKNETVVDEQDPDTINGSEAPKLQRGESGEYETFNEDCGREEGAELPTEPARDKIEEYSNGDERGTYVHELTPLSGEAIQTNAQNLSDDISKEVSSKGHEEITQLPSSHTRIEVVDSGSDQIEKCIEMLVAMVETNEREAEYEKSDETSKEDGKRSEDVAASSWKQANTEDYECRKGDQTTSIGGVKMALTGNSPLMPDKGLSKSPCRNSKERTELPTEKSTANVGEGNESDQVEMILNTLIAMVDTSLSSSSQAGSVQTSKEDVNNCSEEETDMAKENCMTKVRDNENDELKMRVSTFATIDTILPHAARNGSNEKSEIVGGKRNKDEGNIIVGNAGANIENHGTDNHMETSTHGPIAVVAKVAELSVEQTSTEIKNGNKNDKKDSTSVVDTVSPGGTLSELDKTEKEDGGQRNVLAAELCTEQTSEESRDSSEDNCATHISTSQKSLPECTLRKSHQISKDNVSEHNEDAEVYIDEPNNKDKISCEGDQHGISTDRSITLVDTSLLGNESTNSDDTSACKKDLNSNSDEGTSPPTENVCMKAPAYEKDNRDPIKPDEYLAMASNTVQSSSVETSKETCSNNTTEIELYAAEEMTEGKDCSKGNNDTDRSTEVIKTISPGSTVIGLNEKSDVDQKQNNEERTALQTGESGTNDIQHDEDDHTGVSPSKLDHMIETKLPESVLSSPEEHPDESHRNIKTATLMTDETNTSVRSDHKDNNSEEHFELSPQLKINVNVLEEKEDEQSQKLSKISHAVNTDPTLSDCTISCSDGESEPRTNPEKNKDDTESGTTLSDSSLSGTDETFRQDRQSFAGKAFSKILSAFWPKERKSVGAHENEAESGLKTAHEFVGQEKTEREETMPQRADDEEAPEYQRSVSSKSSCTSDTDKFQGSEQLRSSASITNGTEIAPSVGQKLMEVDEPASLADSGLAQNRSGKCNMENVEKIAPVGALTEQKPTKTCEGTIENGKEGLDASKKSCRVENFSAGVNEKHLAQEETPNDTVSDEKGCCNPLNDSQPPVHIPEVIDKTAPINRESGPSKSPIHTSHRKDVEGVSVEEDPQTQQLERAEEIYSKRANREKGRPFQSDRDLNTTDLASPLSCDLNRRSPRTSRLKRRVHYPEMQLPKEYVKRGESLKKIFRDEMLTPPKSRANKVQLFEESTDGRMSSGTFVRNNTGSTASAMQKFRKHELYECELKIELQDYRQLLKWKKGSTTAQQTNGPRQSQDAHISTTQHETNGKGICQCDSQHSFTELSNDEVTGNQVRIKQEVQTSPVCSCYTQPPPNDEMVGDAPEFNHGIVEPNEKIMYRCYEPLVQIKRPKRAATYFIPGNTDSCEMSGLNPKRQTSAKRRKMDKGNSSHTVVASIEQQPTGSCDRNRLQVKQFKRSENAGHPKANHRKNDFTKQSNVTQSKRSRDVGQSTLRIGTKLPVKEELNDLIHPQGSDASRESHCRSHDYGKAKRTNENAEEQQDVPKSPSILKQISALSSSSSSEKDEEVMKYTGMVSSNHGPTASCKRERRLEKLLETSGEATQPKAYHSKSGITQQRDAIKSERSRDVRCSGSCEMDQSQARHFESSADHPKAKSKARRSRDVGHSTSREYTKLSAEEVVNNLIQPRDSNVSSMRDPRESQSSSREVAKEKGMNENAEEQQDEPNSPSILQQISALSSSSEKDKEPVSYTGTVSIEHEPTVSCRSLVKQFEEASHPKAIDSKCHITKKSDSLQSEHSKNVGLPTLRTDCKSAMEEVLDNLLKLPRSDFLMNEPRKWCSCNCGKQEPTSQKTEELNKSSTILKQTSNVVRTNQRNDEMTDLVTQLIINHNRSTSKADSVVTGEQTVEEPYDYSFAEAVLDRWIKENVENNGEKS